jgi:ABC-type Fe3+/spermidine/putrescine transport system ATPase subunit
MQTEFRRIQRDLSITTVFVTHDQTEAMKISDRIAVMNGGKVEQLGTAREIYKTPRTRFVADFIGKINFIPGRAAQTHGDYVAVDTIAGRILAPSIGPRQLHDPLTVGVRPEDLRLIEEPSGPVPANLVSGKLEECTYMGNVAHITIDLGSDIRLLLETRATAETLEPGSAVRVGWKAEETMVFAE